MNNNKTYKDNLDNIKQEFIENLNENNIKFSIFKDYIFIIEDKIYNDNKKIIDNIINNIIKERNINNKYKIKIGIHQYTNEILIEFYEYYFYDNYILNYINAHVKAYQILNKAYQPIISVEINKNNNKIYYSVFNDKDHKIYYDETINEIDNNEFNHINNNMVEYIINLYKNNQKELIIPFIEDLLNHLNNNKNNINHIRLKIDWS